MSEAYCERCKAMKDIVSVGMTSSGGKIVVRFVCTHEVTVRLDTLFKDGNGLGSEFHDLEE